MTMKVGWAALLAASVMAGPAAAQDSFQWLEAPTDPRALSWATQKTEEARTRLAALPEHDAVEAELKTLLAASDPPPEFVFAGPMVLRFQRSVAHPHGVVSVSHRQVAGAPSDWRDVLDVDALRKAENKAYELQFGASTTRCAPPDYTRCLITLSPFGGDEVELREVDLTTGRFVPNGFVIPASRTFAAWLDRDHLLVEHTVGDAPKLPTGWPARVGIWTRGTPLAAAKTVYTAQPTDAIMDVAATGRGADRVGTITRAIDYSTIEHLVVRRDGSVQQTSIPRKVKLILVNSGGGRIYAQLSQEATIEGKVWPAESVVAYDVVKRRLGLVYTPPEGDFIQDPYYGIAPTATGVNLVSTNRGVQRVVTATAMANGWSVSKGAAEPVGTAISFSTADADGNALVVKRAGYLLPNRLDLIRGGSTVRLYDEKPAFDASGFVTELKTAKSKDGTSIDYYLVRPKVTKSGATPLLMTGYGAFGISLSPGYLNRDVGGKSLVPWLTRGGALAMPMIRGGGERGEAWHQAAIREKRQNSYDDFAAVTEAIIKSGLTSPKHIGVFGSSNGGLLAAVMGTQRPDLYGAIVSDVPLTDLVRMPYMGMGAAWLDEYGDAKDAAMLATINRYSPYQNVSPEKTYPPFLVTVATSDNKVGPGHARKMAAKLESAGATVYYLEDQEGGHGVSDSLSRPELMADRMTFLISNLK